MISPYSQPADFQVQPLDWNKAFEVGAIQQRKHDQTEDQAYQLQALMANVPAIDEHKQFKQQLDQKYSGQLNNIYDKIDKNDIQGASQQLRRTYLQFQTDPLKNELINSYEQRQLETKKKIELGDKYAPWGDPNSNFHGSNPDGTIQPLRFKGFQERQDHQKKAEDMMNGLKPSGDDAKGFNFDANGDILSVKKGYEGIAANWVKKIAQAKASDFANTIEGGDFNRQTSHALGRPTNLQDNADYLFHAGMNSIFSKGTSEQDFKYAPKDIRDNSNNQNQAATTNNTEVVNNGTQLPQEISDAKFENGNLVPSQKEVTNPEYQKIVKEYNDKLGESPDANVAARKHALDTGVPTTIKVTDPNSPEMQTQKEFITGLKNTNPSLQNKSDEEVYNAYAEAHKNNTNIGVPYKNLASDENAQKVFSNEVLKGGLNKNSISIAANKSDISQPINLKSIEDKLGLKPNDILKQIRSSNVTGIANGNKPGQFVITVRNSDGAPVDLLVNGSKEQEQYYGRSFLGTQLEREGKTGTNTFIDPLTKQPYISITRIDDQGDGNKFHTAIFSASKASSTDATKTKNYGKIGDDYYLPNGKENYLDPQELLDADHYRYQQSNYYPKHKALKDEQQYGGESEE